MYLFSYLFLLSFSIFKMSNLLNGIFYPLFNVVIFIIICINIILAFMDNFKKGICLFSIICLFLILISLKFKIVSLHEIVILLMCCNANLLNKAKFVRYNFLCILIPVVIVIAMNVLGFIPSVQSYMFQIAGEYKGLTLGFSHPNVTGEIIVGLIISLLICLDYLRHLNRNYKYYKCFYIFMMIVTLFVSIFMFKLTHCRELINFGIITFILLIFIDIPIFKKIFYILVIPLIIIIPSILLYWDYNYDSANSFYVNIDPLSSGRINMQHLVLITYPVKLIQMIGKGPNVTNLNNGTVYIDNSFVALLESCGIISVIIAGIILIKVMYNSIHIDSYILCSVLFALIFCNCIESSLFLFYLDGPLLYVCSIYLQNKRKLKKAEIRN